MTCEVVRTYMSAFMDEALPEGTMADVREHIEGCDSCADIYGMLRAADRFYSAAARREVPEGYRESLRERMEDLVGSERGS